MQKNSYEHCPSWSSLYDQVRLQVDVDVQVGSAGLQIEF